MWRQSAVILVPTRFWGLEGRFRGIPAGPRQGQKRCFEPVEAAVKGVALEEAATMP